MLAGIIVCGACGRRMESAWSHGKAAYRCRRGRITASAPSSERPTFARTGSWRACPPCTCCSRSQTAGTRRRRTRRGAGVRHQSAEDVIGYLREQQISLIYDPADGVLRVGTGETALTMTLKASEPRSRRARGRYYAQRRDAPGRAWEQRRGCSRPKPALAVAPQAPRAASSLVLGGNRCGKSSLPCGRTARNDLQVLPHSCLKSRRLAIIAIFAIHVRLQL